MKIKGREGRRGCLSQDLEERKAKTRLETAQGETPNRVSYPNKTAWPNRLIGRGVVVKKGGDLGVFQGGKRWGGVCGGGGRDFIGCGKAIFFQKGKLGGVK